MLKQGCVELIDDLQGEVISSMQEEQEGLLNTLSKKKMAIQKTI